jgi:hypothetical protein
MGIPYSRVLRLLDITTGDLGSRSAAGMTHSVLRPIRTRSLISPQKVRTMAG